MVQGLLSTPKHRVHGGAANQPDAAKNRSTAPRGSALEEQRDRAGRRADPIHCVNLIMMRKRSAPATRTTERRRTPLAEVITAERMDDLGSRLQGYFSGVEQGEHPPTNEGAARERATLMNEALRNFLLAAAVYVQHRESKVFHALLTSSARWLRQRIQGEGEEFVPRFARQDERFLDRMWAVTVLSLHNRLTSELKRAFREAPRSAGHAVRSHFVDRHGRYGEAQKSGTRRFHESRRQRADLIVEVVHRIVTDIHALPKPRQIDAKVALGWLRTTSAPSALSHLAICRITGLQIRGLKELLRLGRRQDREGQLYRKNAEFRESPHRDSRSVKPVQPT